MDRREYQRTYNHELYRFLRERGLCVYCAQERARPGRVLCAGCAAAANARNRRRSLENNAALKAKRQAWRAAGRCTYCGGEAVGTTYMCRKHWEQRRAQMERRARAEEAADGLARSR